MPKLNIGCGFEKKEGFINIDKSEFVKPDKLVDIEQGLPFPDNYFDYIYSFHCLEHIRPDKWQFTLNEIARVAKNGCVLELHLPFDNIMMRNHVDHYRAFNFGTFDQLCVKDGQSRNYYCMLKLKPLITYNFIVKAFYYLFPMLKSNVKFKFEIVK